MKLLMTLLQFNNRYLQSLIGDLTPEEFVSQGELPGRAHPLWICGHIAVTLNQGLRMLGGQSNCPKEWVELFGMKSKPNDSVQSGISKEEMIGCIQKTVEDLLEVAPAADEKLLAQPNPIEFLRLKTPLQTTEHLLAHLFATHFATHLGQLSYLRRSFGREPMV